MECSVCLQEKRRKTPYTLRLFDITLQQVEEMLDVRPSDIAESLAGIDLRFSGHEDFERAKGALGNFVYSEDNESMEEVVGRLLKRLSLKLSTAESCTAGLLSARVVNVPGSSEYFLGGVVVYSNLLKMELLSVKEETLTSFGAVSKQTCLEMLQGLKERFKTEAGIAITGIAGPGGSGSKPEGLTYIGVYLKEHVRIDKRVFDRSRNENRYLSTQVALNNLRKLLIEEML